jgi:hypothetical protein
LRKQEENWLMEIIRLNKLYFLINIILLVFLWCNISFANYDGDWQFRAQGIINKDFNDKYRLQIGQQTHFGKENTSHHLFKSITDLGFWYWVNKHIIINIDYKQEYTREEKTWFLEKRPHFIIRIRWEVMEFRIETKNRLEFRFKEDSNFENRYRNRIWIRKPIRCFGLIFQPYIMDELFFNLHSDGFNRNRISLGIQTRLGVIQPELFGFWQKTDESGLWINEFTTGIKIILFLK